MKHKALTLLKKFGLFCRANFTPKIVEILSRGYGLACFKQDCLSGVTLTIISIPLAMALAIASGVTPEKGLFTAVVAGFFISLFGGSRYQIGGPTGAFVVVVFNILSLHGYEGLLVAMLIAGVLLVLAGFCRLGTYIKYIPYPVIIGFTSGIAALLFSTQVKDLLGLQIEDLPAEFLPKWRAYVENFSHISWAAVFISALSLGTIIYVRRKIPKIPAFLAVVLVGTIVVFVCRLKVDTIGGQFGSLPHFLPSPHLPDINLELVFKVFPDALTIAFLAGVESLLSATVADAMSGDNHNPNAELVGQGLANIFSAMFSGIPATGAIARTAANVRSGACSPVSGIMQSVFLLLFLLILSPVALFIPLACLAVILVIIAYGMFDFGKFFNLLLGQRGDRATLLVTFFLTIFVDLNAAISVGFIMYAIIFMHRISLEVGAEHLIEYETGGRDISQRLHNQGVMSIRLSGPMFFGGAAKVSSFLKTIDQTPKVLILRMGNVPLVDISGVNVILDFIKKTRKYQTKIILSNVKPQPRKILEGVFHKERLAKEIAYAANFSNAVKMAKRYLKEMKVEETPEVSCEGQILAE